MTTSTPAPLYIGTKTVHATPMTRLAYNDYRSWTLPADENGDDAGFLVEYVDGGKSNDSRHVGYISWSPAEVFERSYKAIPLTTEQMIEASGLTAPRVTKADIEANIVHTEIVKHVSKMGQVLRWAVLTTRNGFAVVGKPSCSVSSANDVPAIGEKLAIENARDELWPLMGYELRTHLADDALADPLV